MFSFSLCLPVMRWEWDDMALESNTSKEKELANTLVK